MTLRTPVRGGGSVVVVLVCGHARTEHKSEAARRTEGMWCRICTEAKAAEAPKPKPLGLTVTPAQLQALVEKAVNARLDELTRPALPSGVAK